MKKERQWQRKLVPE
uniref:Uncharacterized protein n=1 Tax=Rhizophora mucronata TaxID=61149 RepID=A0A2P2R2D4_RHIMU